MKSAMQEDPSAPFIGFSWGPTLDAFPPTTDYIPASAQSNAPSTPRITPLATPSHISTPQPLPGNNTLSTPLHRYNTFSTPNNRPYAFTPFRTNTLPRTAVRTSQRRDLSDREAMKQLVDCVGMSARKKVLESGRKPKVLNNPTSLRSGYGSLTRKELRFKGDPIPMPDYRAASFSMTNNASASLSYVSVAQQQQQQLNGGNPNLPNPLDPQHPTATNRPISVDTDLNFGYSGSETELTDSEGPPSPSPRPGSSLSTSRRSATPTTTMLIGSGGGGGSFSNLSTRSHTPTLMSSGSRNSLRRTVSDGGSSLLATARSASSQLGNSGLGSGQGQVPMQGLGVGAGVRREYLSDHDGRKERGEQHEPLEVKVDGEVVDEETTNRKLDSNGDGRSRNERQNYRDRNIGGNAQASEEDESYHEQRVAPTNHGRSATVTRPQRVDVAPKKFLKAPHVPARAYHDDYEDGLDELDKSESRCFDELEERLSLLIGGIEDIEKRLARAKLAIR
jgi:hypothetical protein